MKESLAQLEKNEENKLKDNDEVSSKEKQINLMKNKMKLIKKLNQEEIK